MWSPIATQWLLAEILRNISERGHEIFRVLSPRTNSHNMFRKVSPLFWYETCWVEKRILIWGLVLLWLIKDSNIFHSLHLQLGFSLQKSGLFDFKIGNSNFYRKNPSSGHFRIYKWNFYFKNASSVNLKICNMNVYPKKSELCAFQKLQNQKTPKISSMNQWISFICNWKTETGPDRRIHLKILRK